MTAAPFKFGLDEEVTVNYPPTARYRRGRRRDGTVQRRSRPKDKNRYAVLFEDGRSADVLIPEHWIERRGQMPLGGGDPL